MKLIIPKILVLPTSQKVGQSVFPARVRFSIGEAGLHTLELAAFVPLTLFLLLSLVDVIRILLTYGQLGLAAENALEAITTGERYQASARDVSATRYRWLRHDLVQGRIATAPLPGYSTTVPAECYSSNYTSCSAEVVALPDSPAVSESNRDDHMDSIREHLQRNRWLQSFVAGQVPECSMQVDASCLMHRTSIPADNPDAIRLELTANVPLLVLDQLLPFTVRSGHTTIHAERTARFNQHYTRTAPLIINQD